jgi:hypothetical protein
MNSICSITPTICDLLGFEPPAASEAEALEEVTGGRHGPGPGAVTRCLIFSPDAIGTVLVRKYASLFLPARQYAPIEVGLRSVMPPKTPVCYASMFTGARPAVHGITKYVKRAPACETLFDVLAREDRSTAIVAVKDSSMDTIFRGAEVEQFTESYDEAVLHRSIELIEAGRHHVIVTYQQRYDDTLHRDHPESPAALDALRGHVESFIALAAAARAAWSGHCHLVTFSPDHGAHYDPATGTGTHGDDVPEDMEVTHFLGLGPAT